MAGLLYFLPNQQPSAGKLDKLRELGLGYAFEEHAGVAQVLSGPSMQPGMVVADKALSENLRGYFPSTQLWLKIPQHPHGAWVGFSSGQRPTPADLARKQQLSGHRVRLADEQDWLVPVARKVVDPAAEALDWFCALPTQVAVDDAGQWTIDQPLARYAPLWRIAVGWWDASVAAEITEVGATFDFRNMLDDTVSALQANYRLDRIECVLLELLTIQHARDVLNALIDWPTVVEWLKKKATISET
jgi:hypothetical protein